MVSYYNQTFKIVGKCSLVPVEKHTVNDIDKPCNLVVLASDAQ